jgi:hypothetical protein
VLKAERDARLQCVKALGRIAYAVLRASKIEGVLALQCDRADQGA